MPAAPRRCTTVRSELTEKVLAYNFCRAIEIRAATPIGDQYYEQTFSIPEPSRALIVKCSRIRRIISYDGFGWTDCFLPYVLNRSGSSSGQCQ